MLRTILFIAGLIFHTAAATAPLQFKLYGRNAIDQEIISARVMNIYQYTSGVVRISWHRNDIDELAKELRQLLIRTGIVPVDIRMDKSIRYDNKSENELLVVSVESYRQPFSCDYQRQHYAYKHNESAGCAVENNLHASLVNRDRIVY